MMRPAHLRVRREDGFTLMEMLVAMALLGVLFAALALAVGSAIRHSSEVEEESTLQTETRAAIDRFAQDLRQAYTGEEDVAPIESIGSTQITFLSPDRATPFHLRRVSYRLSSGVFERAEAVSTDTDGAPWSIPALGGWAKQVGSVVNTTVFTYLDEGGLPTNDPAAVRTVNVTLTVATPASPNRQSTYQTSVTVRSDPQ
jgi:prepilin-type N-terminal cleavage/methylation domain-containing protein